MTIGWILLFRKIVSSGKFYSKVLLPVSQASYGMYLSHLLVLVPVFAAVRGWLGSGAEGLLGFWTTPVEIVLSAIATFVITSVFSVLIRRIPVVGKYIVG
jgi:surface polysaccharide O-acyltransferase-like enzyme